MVYKKNVLITGATGFIGKHLVHEFSKQKKYNYTCFVRKPINVNFIIGHLEDKNSLLNATKNIDCVIHLAGEVRSSKKELSFIINVTGTKNLIEACQENKVKRLIFSGTVNADLKKKGVYGESKKHAEELVKNSKLDYVILKLNMVYGPGDNNLSKTIKLIKKLPFVPIIGDGNKKIQPVYIDDVVKSIFACLETKKLKNRIYNIAGPYAFSFNEYIQIILNSLNIKRIKIHIPVILIRSILTFSGNLFDNIINFEIVNSISQNKDVNITESKKDLNFYPKEFKPTVDYLIKERKM